MSITAINAYDLGTGNGSNKVFPFTFACKGAAEVGVFFDGVQQFAGFVTTVNANGVGGNVTFTAAPGNNVKVAVASDPLFTQLVTFGNAGQFLPASHDTANDRAAIRDVYIKGRLDRMIQMPWGEAGLTVPSAVASRASRFLGFDVNGVLGVYPATGAAGPAATFTTSAVGLAVGQAPTAVISGSNGNYAIQFGIPVGATGAQGNAATVAVGTVTTGAAGTSVIITNAGTSQAAVFNFTIPRGDTGASGALSNGTFGDIVVTGGGVTLTVGNGAISLAKMANLAANSIMGNNTGAGATPIALTAAQTKTLLALVKGDVGLGNVDNTSDVNKPVSTATQTALNTKADLAGPALTGNPTATTQAVRDNSTRIATTAYVDRLYDTDVTLKTGAYTPVLGDRGYCISTNSAVHIPPNSSVAYPVGTFLEIYNSSGTSITIDFSSGTDVFRKNGSASTVTTLTLAAYSTGQLRKLATTTEWQAYGFA